MNDPSFPPFRPRFPWFNGDLQTIRDAIVGRPVDLAEGQRLWLPLDDGDALAAALHVPDQDPGRPLVVLIHGLTGSENSAYIRSAAAHLLYVRTPVLRLNLRGNAVSRPRSSSQYHGGRSGDLRQALRALPDRWKARGVMLVGYSLGGAVLLKFLAEEGATPAPGLPPILASCSVCAPIDLAAATRTLGEERNATYAHFVVREMKAEALAVEARDMPPAMRRSAERANSILEYDETVTAPRFGFASAAAFYETNRSDKRLAEIRVPTLCLAAADDPWIDDATYRRIDWAGCPAITPHIASGGGHVGFHSRDDGPGPGTWADRVVAQFLFRYG